MHLHHRLNMYPPHTTPDTNWSNLHHHNTQQRCSNSYSYLSHPYMYQHYTGSEWFYRFHLHSNPYSQLYRSYCQHCLYSNQPNMLYMCHHWCQHYRYTQLYMNSHLSRQIQPH